MNVGYLDTHPFLSEHRNILTKRRNRRDETYPFHNFSAKETSWRMKFLCSGPCQMPTGERVVPEWQALVSLLSALLCFAAGLVWLAWDPGPGLGCQDLPQVELHGKSKHSGQAEMVRPTYDKRLKMLLCEMWLWDKHCCWQFVLNFCVNSQRQKCSCWRKCWWKMSHLCFSGSSVRSRNWAPMIPDVAFRD